MRTHPIWEKFTVYEKIFQSQGLIVAGTDEVGRGPLAGPVMAAAVILDLREPLDGLDDSKRLTEKQRFVLYQQICERSPFVGVGAVGPRTIERINILEAARLAMRRAVSGLAITPQVVLSDAMRLPGAPYYTVDLIRGDQRSASVAAASVVAKVVRDRYMEELSLDFPQYGFSQHKGYPTPAHREALIAFGRSPAHRATFLHGPF